MSKAFLSAFVMIAGVAVAGVDYVNQAKVAGQTPGAFGIGDYVGTIPGRFASQQQETAVAKARSALLAMDMRDHLPEAPEGWTRRDWDADAEALLAQRHDMARDDFLPEQIRQDPTLKALSALDKAATARKDATEVYVYEKPGALVALRLRLAPADGGGGIAGMAMQIAANNIEAMSGKDGFAVVKGVTYREELGMFGTGAEERAYRVLTAEIGGRVRISVRARAGEADILALLSGIDYDRLNRLLDAPVAGIGSDAPEIDPAATRDLARAQVAAAADAQRLQAIEHEHRALAAALDLNHRMGTISEADYETGKADLDARIAKWQALAGAPAETAILADAPAAPATGGGLWGMISGVLGGGKTDAGAGTAASEVKVNRIGGSNCTVSGGVKRCSIGGD